LSGLRRAARLDARPDSGVRQFGSELLWIATRRPSRVDPLSSWLVTGLDAVSLSLGVAGDFGCKLRSRYLVLVLEQPFTLFVIARGSVSTPLWLDTPPAVQAMKTCAL